MDLIRTQGRRITRQRRLVLETLRDSQEHLDAYALFERVKVRDSKISLATVYRSLALLKESGLVQENRLGEDHGHFEATQATPHYHFTCLGCGCVIEFEAPQVMEVVATLCSGQALQVTGVNLHLSGYCADCHAPGQDGGCG